MPHKDLNSRAPGLRVFPFHGWRGVDRVVLGAFIALLLLLVWFTGAYGHVARNRVNDSWCHIARADAFLRTGQFGMDPFIPNAPPLAQFGLLDMVTAGVARVSGLAPEQAWSWALAINVLVVGACCYGCGRAVSGTHTLGAIAFAVWLAYAGDLSIQGMAFPFLASLPCREAFLLWLLRTPAPARWRVRRSMLAGALLGLIFALHNLTGLWTLMCAGMLAAADLVAAWRGHDTHDEISRAVSPHIRIPAQPSVLIGVVSFGASFVVAAFPWLRMQFALRPLLELHHAQRDLGYGFLLEHLLVAAAVVGTLVAAVSSKRVERELRHLNAWFLVWALVACLFAIRPLNLALADKTSDHMANRVLMFVPILVATGTLGRLLLSHGLSRTGPALAVVSLLILLAVPLHRRLSVIVYLARTHDLDTSGFAHLQRLSGLNLRGKLLLSDAYTSFFARGMLGCHAVSVPGNLGSPCLDYDSRNALARASLRTARLPGFLRMVGVVIVEKRAGFTRQLSGESPEVTRTKWLAAGWTVAYEDRDVLALVPSPACQIEPRNRHSANGPWR